MGGLSPRARQPRQLGADGRHDPGPDRAVVLRDHGRGRNPLPRRRHHRRRARARHLGDHAVARRLPFFDRHRQVPLRDDDGVHRRPAQPDRDDAVDGKRPGAAAGAGRGGDRLRRALARDALGPAGRPLPRRLGGRGDDDGRGLRAHVPRGSGDDDPDHDARHAAGGLPRPRGPRAHSVDGRRPGGQRGDARPRGAAGHAAHRAGADHARRCSSA